MAGRIPQQFIDDLVSRVDIVDLIDGYVSLRKGGRDYVACCPFHEEKTPSFTVSRDKQFYHCFGCGAHGTAIGFLMAYEHLDFVEAISDLAHRIGLEVPQETRTGDAPQHQLFDVLDRAAAYYRRQLKDNAHAKQAISYLKQRGLSGDVAAQFNIGYAPPGWDNVLKELGAAGMPREELARAGLIVERERDKYYDRFRDRIMFPIRDTRGRVIGFGGRVLGDETPKYLNSPETPLFHKGRELYGLYEACQSNRHLKQLIVVEGYMDVVALAQFGITNAVATLGTATTHDHIERLFRKTAEVIFCFDGDRAGREAAWRALENALPAVREGRQIRFMFLPDGDDPDTLVRREGKATFELRYAASVSLSAYFFETLSRQADTSSIDGRARLVELARPLLNKIPAGIFQHMMVEQLAALAHTDAATVNGIVASGAKASIPAARTPAARISGGTARPSPVRTAIACLLHQPSLAATVNHPARLTSLDVPGIKLLVQILELVQSQPHLNSAALIEHWRDTDDGRQLTKLARIPNLIPEGGIAAEFTGAIARLDEALRRQRLGELTSKNSLTQEEKLEIRRLQTEIGAPAG